jgi:hypothetical protein
LNAVIVAAPLLEEASAHTPPRPRQKAASHPLALVGGLPYFRFSTCQEGNPAVAKGQKKSNKEIRKPKKEKPKASPAGSSGKGLGPKQSDF